MNRGTLAWAGGGLLAGMLLTAAYYIRGGKAPGFLVDAFSANTLTDADYEEMHVEKSGSTVDTVPVGLSESFQGAMYLPLQYTTSVANDAPGGPGVIDWQVIYTDPYKIGGDQVAQLPSTAVDSYQDATNPDPNNGNSPVNGGVGNSLKNAETFNSLAPGQGVPYSGANNAGMFDPNNPMRIQHSIRPVNTDATGAFDLALYDSSRQSRTNCCPIPAEWGKDYPYVVETATTPWKEEPNYTQGGNRFGSLARQSGEDDVNGRMGKVALDPDVNSAYMGTGADGNAITQTLNSWRMTHNIQRQSDTEIMAISKSSGPTQFLRRV
jgi:hypothetical protein